MAEEKTGPVARIVRAATRIEPHELRATILSFLFVFTLMAAYFANVPSNLSQHEAADKHNTRNVVINCTCSSATLLLKLSLNWEIMSVTVA